MNDTYFIRLKGKANIPDEMEIDQNYTLIIQGSVTEKKESSNQDGTKNISWTFEPIIVEAVNELGKKIVSKDTRRRSQQLRATLFRAWQNNNDGTDFDEWYDRKMLSIISNVLEE